MICGVNNVPIPQTNFNVRPVSVVRLPSVTDNLRREYYTISGYEIFHRCFNVNQHFIAQHGIIPLKFSVTEGGLILEFVCGIGAVFIPHHKTIIILLGVILLQSGLIIARPHETFENMAG